MACVCYWGCGNVGNRVCWAIVAVLFFTGLGLAIGGGVSGRDCFDKYNNCMKNIDDSDLCTDLADEVCQLRKWARMVLAGIILVAAAAASTSYFCCCTSRPPTMSTAGGPMVVTAAPVGQPKPGEYVVYGQPGAYPPPPYGSYPQQPTYSGYPPMPAPPPQPSAV